MSRFVKYFSLGLCGILVPLLASATSVTDLERQIRASDQARLQMQQQLDQMSQELNMLVGKLEETNNAMSDLQKNQQDLFQQISDLTARMNQLQTSGATATKTTPTTTNTNTNAATTGSAKTANQEPTPKPVASLVVGADEKSDYQKAVALVLNDKNYNGAIDAFNGFIKKYPNSSLISNANFWLGDSYFKTNRLTDARQCFLNVIKEEKSGKRAESLYKLGLISATENNNDYAKKFFQLVIRDYEGTTTARLAENELKKLK